MNFPVEQKLISPEGKERHFGALAVFIEKSRTDSTFWLTNDKGESFELPAELIPALQNQAQALGAGHGIAIEDLGLEMSFERLRKTIGITREKLREYLETENKDNETEGFEADIPIREALKLVETLELDRNAVLDRMRQEALENEPDDSKSKNLKTR